MSIDYAWMSNGGLLLDGTGDIAFTSTDIETVISMVRTRLKSAVDGWKLYRIGCGLDNFRGDTSDSNEESLIQRQVISQISNGYLPPSLFTVSTLRLGGDIQIYVYLSQSLIATANITLTPTS